MKLNSISGVLYKVDSLDRTAEFYEKLGFRVGKRSDFSLTVYVNWFWVEFILAGEHGAMPGNGQFLYISVDSVDELNQFLLEKGIKPDAEPQDYASNRRELMVTDPDGYKLVFFQKLK